MIKRIYSLKLLLLIAFSLFSVHFPCYLHGRFESPALEFEFLGIEQGLGQSSIYSICQDKKGFIWLATEGGLNRYDGYDFKIYSSDRDNPASLSHNFVYSIIEDPAGILWIGTEGGGLNRYDRENDSFIHYRDNKKNSSSLNSDRVRSIFQDRSGTLWVGTWTSGLNKCNTGRKKFGKHIFGPDASKGNQTTLTPILDDAGNVVRLVTIDTDITRLKESEEEIRQKSLELENANEIAWRERRAAELANQSKSEFLARMSHEIRTPMNGVIGFTEMLLDTQLSEAQMDHCRTISRSADALVVLINDILDFSKIEAGELKLDCIDFDPELTVFDVCELIRPRLGRKPVEILCRVDDHVPAFVKGDAGRFRQIIVNLVGNAVKFTHKGEIEVSLSVAAGETGKLKLLVVVRESNPHTIIPHIEESFETARPFDICIMDIEMPQTSGFEIARQIRRLNPPLSSIPLLAFSSSTMTRSQKYRESGFNGFLPKPIRRKKMLKMVERLLDDNKSDEPAPGGEEIFTQHSITEEAKHSTHILLAEDNPVNQKLARFLLTKAGYRLTTVNNGREAVETFTASPGTFDLILMDIQMPEMDGKEAMKGDKEKCLEAGMDDYISKPIKRELILEMVSRWCLEKS